MSHPGFSRNLSCSSYWFSRAGVQRAAALCRGLGRDVWETSCPQKRFLSSRSRRRRRRAREKTFLGTPQAPAGRTLHPWFWERFQKFEMTHIPIWERMVCTDHMFGNRKWSVQTITSTILKDEGLCSSSGSHVYATTQMHDWRVRKSVEYLMLLLSNIILQPAFSEHARRYFRFLLRPGVPVTVLWGHPG